MVLIPAAQAADVEADLRATSLQVEGHAQIEGLLSGLILDLAYGTGSARADFLLNAAHLRVEADYVDPAMGEGAVAFAHEPQTNSDSYERADVKGLELREDYETLVLPIDARAPPLFEVRNECSTIAPSETPSVERVALVDAGRPERIVDTSQTTMWSGCPASEVAITGDFLVVMWGHDAQLTTSTESVLLESGRLNSEQSPHPSLDSAVHRRQQLFLYATNATLTYPLVPGQYGLFLSDVTANTQSGTIILQDARGHLDIAGASMNLEGERLALTGELGAQAVQSVPSRSIRLVIGGDATTGYRDGQALGMTAPAPPEAGTTAWIAASTVLAAAGLFLLWWIPLLQCRNLPATQGLSKRQRHAWIYNQRGLARYRQARFLRAWTWASLASLLDARAKHVQLRCKAATGLGWKQAALRDHDRLDSLLVNAYNRLENAHQAHHHAQAWNLTEAEATWHQRIRQHEAPFLDMPPQTKRGLFFTSP